MTLLRWELKKILKRRMTRVLLALCLAVVLLLAGTTGFANLSFGTEVEAPTWEARARCVQATRDAAAWHGPLDGGALLAAQAGIGGLSQREFLQLCAQCYRSITQKPAGEGGDTPCSS